MTTQHTIYVDLRSDTDDVSIRARVDRLATKHGPFAAVHLSVGDDEQVLIVTRPTNARRLVRALTDALADLDDWATDQPVPDPEPVSSAPDPGPTDGTAYVRAAS